MAGIPNISDLQATKINMDSIDEFISSGNDTLNDQYGDTRKTLKGVETLSDDAINRVDNAADAAIIEINEKVSEVGVIYDDPIRLWSPSLLVSDLRAHRNPDDVIVIPRIELPFTTGATYDVNNWALLQDPVDKYIQVDDEDITLVDGQTTVIFSTITTTGTIFKLHSDGADSATLFEGVDYTVTNESTIELEESYPSGSIIKATVHIVVVDTGTVRKVHSASTLLEAQRSLDAQRNDSVNLAERTTGNSGDAMWDYIVAGTTAGVDLPNTFDIVACTGVPTLALVLRKGANLPAQFGAIMGVNDAPTIATNNDALQAYATYCMENKLLQDYRGGEFFYDSTLDMTLTSTRNAFVYGDCDNSNNDARFNLVYLGSGNAITCKSITHYNLGLAGTDSVVDSIPLTSVGIAASESVKHWGSCIRNFDKGYVITGGFYHGYEQGRLSRCRTLWDFTGAPGGLYNTRFNVQCTDFVDGIVANGGNGPLNLAGSFESWTGAVVTKTAGEPAYKVVLEGAYIENRPSTTVAAGLTGNDLDTYIAPRILNLASSSVSGTATVLVNSGITSELMRASLPQKIVNIDWDLYDGSTLPPRLFHSPSIIDCELKLAYQHDSNFDSATVLGGGAQVQGNSTGSYTKPDGAIAILDGDDWHEITLLNDWANGVDVKALSYKVINDVLYVTGRMLGASATSIIIGVIPPALLASIPDTYTFFPVGSQSITTEGRLITSSGNLTIETTGTNNLAINIAIPLK